MLKRQWRQSRSCVVVSRGEEKRAIDVRNSMDRIEERIEEVNADQKQRFGSDCLDGLGRRYIITITLTTDVISNLQWQWHTTAQDVVNHSFLQTFIQLG